MYLKLFCICGKKISHEMSVDNLGMDWRYRQKSIIFIRYAYIATPERSRQISFLPKIFKNNSTNPLLEQNNYKYKNKKF